MQRPSQEELEAQPFLLRVKELSEALHMMSYGGTSMAGRASLWKTVAAVVLSKPNNNDGSWFGEIAEAVDGWVDANKA